MTGVRLDDLRQAAAYGEINLTEWFSDKIEAVEELSELGFNTQELFGELQLAFLMLCSDDVFDPDGLAQEKQLELFKEASNG